MQILPCNTNICANLSFYTILMYMFEIKCIDRLHGSQLKIASHIEEIAKIVKPGIYFRGAEV